MMIRSSKSGERNTLSYCAAENIDHGFVAFVRNDEIPVATMND